MAFTEDIELITRAGRCIGIAEYGDSGGFPVFFFHGWPSSRRQARILHESALSRQLRVIAVDRPGIGKSTFVPDRKLMDWPPLLEELAGRLQIEKFSVLGVSGGGPYALAVAHALPSRLAATGIVCCAPPLVNFSDRRDLHPAYRAMLLMRGYAAWSMAPFLPIARRAAQLPFDHLVVRCLKLTIPKPDRRALEDQRAFAAISCSFLDASCNGMRPLIVDGDIYSSDWGFDLAGIQVPVRFWHGEKDRNVPARMVSEFVQWIPQAVLHLYPEEGHFSLPILRQDEILDQFVEDASSRS